MSQLERLAVVGSRVPQDLTPRRRVVHVVGLARPLHLGDYLGAVPGLRALAADPGIDLTVVIGVGDGADRDCAARVAGTLVACGLGSVAFTTDGEVGAEVVHRPEGPVVMDLREARSPMGSVPGNDRGVVRLLDDPMHVAAAVRGARLDLDPMLGYDPQLRPGVANLAVILGALTGRSPIAALFGLHGGGALKRAVTDALVETLRPIQAQYRDLAADPAMLRHLLD
jgi:tryptophanyl-tRNA synthetase